LDFIYILRTQLNDNTPVPKLKKDLIDLYIKLAPVFIDKDCPFEQVHQHIEEISDEEIILKCFDEWITKDNSLFFIKKEHLVNLLESSEHKRHNRVIEACQNKKKFVKIFKDRFSKHILNITPDIERFKKINLNVYNKTK